MPLNSSLQSAWLCNYYRHGPLTRVRCSRWPPLESQNIWKSVGSWLCLRIFMAKNFVLWKTSCRGSLKSFLLASEIGAVIKCFRPTKVRPFIWRKVTPVAIGMLRWIAAVAIRAAARSKETNSQMPLRLTFICFNRSNFVFPHPKALQEKLKWNRSN